MGSERLGSYMYSSRRKPERYVGQNAVLTQDLSHTDATGSERFLTVLVHVPCTVQTI